MEDPKSSNILQKLFDLDIVPTIVMVQAQPKFNIHRPCECKTKKVLIEN